MKRLRVVTVLLATAGAVLSQGRAKPIYAASQAAATSPQVTPSTAGSGSEAAGATSYAKHCAVCHGDQREGILPAFPPLLGIHRQMNDQQLTEIIRKGKGRMPGFPKVQHEELTALVHFLSVAELPPPTEASSTTAGTQTHAAPSGPGNSLYQQNCAFCHGRDAGGGESGPDLTRSKLVSSDVGGDKISEVVRNGRNNGDRKMPRFNFSSDEMANLVVFVHAQAAKAASQKGNRKGVDVADLQTGNVEAGRQYFNGAGGCAKCHSPTGDLAGVATRYQGLQLEERMLYPRNAKSTVAVTLSSGEVVSGTLAYIDEFTIGLRDGNGVYRSWKTSMVKFKVDSPVDAHVEQFRRYTDANIHDLMAYVQTMR